MKKKHTYKLATRVIHEGVESEKWEGATLPPVFQTSAYVHETAQGLSDTFAGKTGKHIYSRMTNPTNEALEAKMMALENGKGAIVMASGMAAINNTCMALLRAGDNFVSNKSLFMSSYVLFTGILKKYNITVKLADFKTPSSMEALIDDKTRFIYMETIGNPAMDVPDIKALADLAHKNGLPLVVDNTLATPYLVTPISLGADVVIHSTTKYLSGHGSATGGVVIDGGNFDWSGPRFDDFKPFVDRKGDLALLDRIWREHHINFGTTQAPMHSYLTLLGIDTFVLRMERHMENALSVARFLKDQPQVSWVNYPGFDDHPFYHTAQNQFNGKGFGGLLTFGLKDQASCFKLIDSLCLISHLANLGDCKTLIIHPFSTQYVSFEDDKKTQLGITPGLLRLSVGIEDADDINQDLAQALSLL